MVQCFLGKLEVLLASRFVFNIFSDVAAEEMARVLDYR